MWWLLVIVAFGGVSIMTWSPIPVGLAVVGWLIAQIFERPLRAEVAAAGRNPELPPAPTTPTNVLTFLLWAICWVALLLLLLGVFGVALIGALGGG